jgi:hypothetical protein
MWHTPSGNRALAGPEAVLIREAIGAMSFWIAELGGEYDGYSPTGVSLFDALDWRSKLAMLAEVGTGLFDPAMPPPKLTAINEATIAAIYTTIRTNIIVEIESVKDCPEEEPPLFWRKLVHPCLDNDMPSSAKESLPAVTCDDPNEWEWMLDAVEAQVLWDDDYEPFAGVMDGAPEEAARVKACLGIVGDYYEAIAPDPTESDMPQIYETLELLTGRRLPFHDS